METKFNLPQAHVGRRCGLCWVGVVLGFVWGLLGWCGGEGVLRAFPGFGLGLAWTSLPWGLNPGHHDSKKRMCYASGWLRVGLSLSWFQLRVGLWLAWVWLVGGLGLRLCIPSWFLNPQTCLLPGGKGIGSGLPLKQCVELLAFGFGIMVFALRPEVLKTPPGF